MDSSKIILPAAAAAATAAALWSFFKPPARKKISDDLELLYFDIEGKAESIRLAAVYGGLQFKDTRLTHDEFKAMQQRGDLAFGQVPALRVGNAPPLAQSAAILKLVGKKAGLYPLDDDLLAARVDSLMDEEADFFCGITVSRYPFRFGFDAVGVQGVLDRSCASTQQVRAKLNAEVLPKHLTHLEAILSASPSGWLAGTPGPTVADFQIAPRIPWLVHENDGITPKLLDDFPKVRALVQKVYELPSVTRYYAARGKVFDAKSMKLLSMGASN